MMRTPLATAFLLLAFSSFAEEPAAPDAGKLPPAAKRTVDYIKDVKPILERSCVSCHGAEKQRAGLRLDSRDEALNGGNGGPVLKPGSAAGSRLLLIVAGLDAETAMPPKGKTPLTAAEVGILRAWVEQGLSWPKDGATVAQGPKSDHWAFNAPKSPPLPAVKTRGWTRNGLDSFILARLEKEGLNPSPEADRATLIRRLSLDLLGLPPTPREVDDFVNDAKPQAYERLVDRLLASPHYGERWGRHWLDAARYADSDGYEKDTGRPFAWRWRDWVIKALNSDLPYDKFTVEQLAGDLLPGATLEQKIATGFHRNTLTNKEGGVDQEQFRVEAVVNRVSTTAQVFLGLTMACAQCHDHKYDPLSQREYYQFLAFFDSDTEVDLPAPTPAEDRDYRERKAAHDKRRQELLAAVTDYKTKSLPVAQEKWEKGLSADAIGKLPAPVAAALKTAQANRTAAEQKAIADHYAKTDTQLTALNAKVTAHDRQAPKLPIAQTLALGKERKTHVMIRGDFLRKGVEVAPGTPAVLSRMSSSEKSPTRLDLARWITHRDNPLTARVAVNWVWHKYFGRGLVNTLEDFGTQGEKPSHPELLDWLAVEFMDRQWGLKDLHRLIVTSATYRQSSAVRPELARRDPLNVLLARQSRLRAEAEVTRDLALAVSGLLTRGIGGPSVRPPQPAGISELSYANSVKWVESIGPDRYRRGLYIWFQRTSPYPTLMTFDAPDSNVCVVRREKSNTPLQALALMNDAVFVEGARALGRRIVEETPGADVRARVTHGFRLALGRKPAEAEVSRLSRLFEDLHALAKSEPNEAAKLLGKDAAKNVPAPEAAAWVALARVLLNLDEFITRE